MKEIALARPLYIWNGVIQMASFQCNTVTAMMMVATVVAPG